MSDRTRYRLNWPTDLKPIPRPIQQQIDDGFWTEDDSLQQIADAYRVFIEVSDQGTTASPESRLAFKKVLESLDALVEGNDE